MEDGRVGWDYAARSGEYELEPLACVAWCKSACDDSDCTANAVTNVVANGGSISGDIQTT